MKIAILGGTFNPIHIGHLMLAEDVRKEFGYDKILFIPACVPPHKVYQASVSDADRLEMIRLAIADNPYFDVDSCELQRKGVSYTIDTIYDLESRYQEQIEGKIGLIIGDDLLNGFGSWHLADALALRVRLIVGRRLYSTLPLESPFPFPPLSNSILPISSSEIRQKIQSKKSWRYLVPNSVFQYIESRNLYE